MTYTTYMVIFTFDSGSTYRSKVRATCALDAIVTASESLSEQVRTEVVGVEALICD